MRKIRRFKSAFSRLAALKVDFNKAYDRINWNFIEALLHKIRFPVTFIRLIMQCVSTYSLLVNGSPSPIFKPSVQAPVNSFEFRSCDRTPQAECFTR